MTAAEPTERRRSGRGFKILIGVAIAIVILWSGGWFAARHFVAGKIGAIVARAEAEGATLACGAESLSGFPFRLAITCTPLAASCPAEDASLSLAGFEATGLVYNPGHLLFAAKGPLTLTGPGGTTANATWTDLESSLRVGFSGLKRYSIVSNGLDATLTAPGRLDGPVAFKADHAEFHVVPDPDAADTIDLFATIENGVATIPGRAAVPPMTTNFALGVPKGVLEERHDAVGAWIASGQPLHIHRAEFDVDGLAVNFAGDATVDTAGLISGDFTVRLSALDRLPELVERFRPGAGQRVARLIAPVSALLRPVNADGRDWREARITVRNGRAAMGFIPLGRIPPVRSGAVVATLPAVAPLAPSATETAPVASPPAKTAPDSTAATAAPSPSPATQAAEGAARAIEDLVAPLKVSGRCSPR